MRLTGDNDDRQLLRRFIATNALQQPQAGISAVGKIQQQCPILIGGELRLDLVWRTLVAIKAIVIEHQTKGIGDIGVIRAHQNTWQTRQAICVHFLTSLISPRQQEEKFGSLPIDIMKTDLAVMLLDNRAGNTQPQSGTALLSRIRAVRLRKPLENLAAKGFRNTPAPVPHADPPLPSRTRQRDIHRRPFRGKLDGIGNQVRQNLLQAVIIKHRRCRCRGLQQFQADAKLLGIAQIADNCLIHRRAQVAAGHLEIHAIRFPLLHIENVVDQEAEPLTVAAGVFEKIAALVRQVVSEPGHQQAQCATQ